jgi:hypothetical protein
MTKLRVTFALVATMATAALMLSGCSTASSDASATAGCQEATTQLEAADASLTDAQANLDAVLRDDNKVGTRYEDDANAAVEDAQKQQEAALDVKNTACVATPTPTPSASAEACATTWPIVLSDNTNNRWFADGIVEIKEATDEASARRAAQVWLEEVRKDPRLLAGAAKYFLNRDVETSTLQDGECASDAAVTLVTELELAIAEAKVETGEAPVDGYNSGVSGDAVVGAAQAGVSGDREAIKVTLEDGTVIWIMARCGNPVTAGPPSVPPGPTDEPLCPDGTPIPPNGLCEKNDSENVLNNPDVPDQVKGPGTTPVGTDPGPATPAVDTPTGYATPSPAPTPWTPPTATPVPTTPPEVSNPEPVIPTPAPSQSADPVTTCDENGDGIPDDSCG